MRFAKTAFDPRGCPRGNRCRRGASPRRALLLASSVILLATSRSALAAAYPAPDDGWTYLFQGEGVASGQTSSLDGTWNRQNSLDAWAGDGRGAGNGAIGGVSASNGILTIEDALAGGSGYDNRRFYFTHDLAQDTGVTNAATLLDDGVTITFRARLTPPTDPLLELGGVAGGWVNHGDGKGIFGIRQSGAGGLAIAFSLHGPAEDLSTNSGFQFGPAGLHMNSLNGDVRSAAVDPGEGGALNLLSLDPRLFHEFWVTIENNGASPGTHRVAVYVDGSRTPAIFHVTAGSGSDGPFANYLALGLGHTGQRGAVDIDFFGYKPGVIVPAGFDDPVGFSFQPADQSVSLGQIATFNAGVTGTPPYQIQWYRDGAPIPGATNASYSTAGVTSADNGAGFVVVARNAFNSVTSSPPARIRIGGAPAFTRQPQSLTVARGDTVSFTVTISSATPPTFQWRFNGNDIPGATRATLTVTNASFGNAGTYDVIVANASGSVASAPATLTVRDTDFGDAPEPGYATLRANNGARHSVVPGIALGSTVDGEADGQPDANASGDDAAGNDDEDGISFQTPLRAGLPVTLQAVASVNGILSAWLDFNRDGSWAGVGEQIFTNQSLVAGVNTLQFVVPSEAVPGSAFARFRFNSTGGLSFSGPAPDGEVEDYRVTIDPTVDLVVSQTDTPDPMPVGATVTYVVTVRNAGLFKANNVSLVDLLPAGVSFVSATASQGSCTPTAGQVNCALGALHGGSLAQVTLVLTATAPGTLVNSATASSSEPDLNPADNSHSAMTAALAPPSIVTQPQNRIVTNGTTAVLTVVAAGGEPLFYQWRRDGLDLPGQTASSLVLPNVQPADAGAYTVRVSNPVGLVLSVAATLTVLETPMFILQPRHQTNYVGSTATFTSMVLGTPPLFYQWFFNGSPIAGAVSSNYSRVGVQAAHAGTYQLRVTNQVGSTFSTPAVLTVFQADFGDAPEPAYPTVLTNDGARHRISSGLYLGARVDADANGQPTSGAAGDDLAISDDEDGVTFSSTPVVGRTASLRVVASGSGLLNAWMDFNRNNSWTDAGEQIFTNLPVAAGTNLLSIQVPVSAIAGATFARFRFSTAADIGITGEAPDGEVEDYLVGILGAVDVQVTKLEGTDPIAVGSNLTYSVIVSNGGPSTATSVSLSDPLPATLTFVSVASIQGNCSLIGSTVSCVLGAMPAGGTVTLTLVVRPNAAGNLVNTVTVTAIDTDINAANNSATATTAAYLYPRILTQPQGQTVTNGGTASLTISAVGTALRYHWQFNGLDLPGATNAVLNIPNAQPAHAGNYTVRITNEVGAVMSGAATLSVLVPVSLLSQPQSLTVGAGGTATFTVSATGTGPLTYQWQFNGTDIGGENSPSLVLEKVQLSQSGTYRVRVANAVNSVLSLAATLSVRDLPVIIGQPQSRTNLAGTTATFSVMATGLPPVLYQWYFNQTTPLSGATGPTLSLPDVQEVHTGDYSVTVRDSRGAVTSAVAVLTVHEIDFGDAPDSLGYPTTLAFNGARHRLLPGVYLGSRADFEVDGLPNTGANGDDTNNTDDEDGVSFVEPLLLAQTAMASVVASTNGFIDAWIDFNRNGTWTDPGERILDSRAVAPGTNLLSFQIPAVAVSVTTFARFRFSTTGGLSYEGFAADGEVEDHPVAVRPAVDLVLTQAASANPVTVTSNFAYTVTLSNRGPSSASSVSLTNVLPPNVTFLSATPSQGSCSAAAGRLTCNLGTLLRDAGAVVTIHLRAQSPGTAINTITAGGFETDLNAADNTATVTTAIVVPTVTLINANALVVADGTEAGPGTANPYPSTILVSGMTAAVHSVTVRLSDLTHSFPSDLDILLVGPHGQSALVMSDAGAGFGVTNITVTVDDAADSVVPNVGPLQHGFSYQPSTYDPASDNFPPPAPTGSWSTNLSVFRGTDPNGLWSLYVIDDDVGDTGRLAGGWRLSISTSDLLTDLDVTLAGAPQITGINSNITYSFTVTNRGPAPASGVKIIDPLPPGVSFVNATASQGLCFNQSNVVTCELGNLGAGARATATIVFRALQLGQITNSATATDNQRDLLPDNNTASVVSSVRMVTDLAVTQAASTNIILPGQNLPFNITVTNRGPGSAGGVWLTNIIPTGASFLSAMTSRGSCSHVAGMVICDLGSLGPAAGALITVLVTPPSSGSAISTAIAATTEFDPNGANSSATTAVTIARLADLAIQASGTPPVLPAGGNLTYDIAVTNLGPWPATSVQTTSTFPASVTFVSAHATQGACTQQGGLVNCAIGNLATGAGARVTLVVTPTQPATLAQRIGVLSSDMDPVPANSTALVVTSIRPLADLALTQSASTNFVPVDSPVIFRIDIANNGPGGAGSVRVTNTLPPGVDFVSAAVSQGSCSGAGATVTCALGTVAASSTATVTIVGRPIEAGNFLNTASVTSDAVDPTPENDVASVSIQSEIVSDLALGLRAAPTVVPVGSNLVYTVTVTNRGPLGAIGVQLTNTLPPALSFVSATPSQGACTHASGIVHCALGALPIGASVTVLVTARAMAGGGITDLAAVGSRFLDPAPSNNLQTITTAALAPPQILSISHAGGISTILFPTVTGVTYTVEYINSVNAAGWSSLASTGGTGGVMRVEDSSANVPARIYRVRGD